MDLNQLKYFISVVETLNFTEAARRNGLTQPAISHHISELEKFLEVHISVYRLFQTFPKGEHR